VQYERYLLDYLSVHVGVGLGLTFLDDPEDNVSFSNWGPGILGGVIATTPGPHSFEGALDYHFVAETRDYADGTSLDLSAHHLALLAGYRYTAGRGLLLRAGLGVSRKVASSGSSTTIGPAVLPMLYFCIGVLI
jgi:hypothetical protein